MDNKMNDTRSREEKIAAVIANLAFIDTEMRDGLKDPALRVICTVTKHVTIEDGYCCLSSNALGDVRALLAELGIQSE